EEARPRQVFEFVGAKLRGFGLGLEVKRDWREDTGGGFACSEVFCRGAEDVDVLGVGEVGKKEKHAAQCPPEAEDAEGIGVGGSEEMGDCGGKGLEGVGAFGGDTGSGSDGAAADVEENKGGDDQRVNGDFGAEDVGMKERAVVKAKVASTGKGEAAKD